MAVAFEDSGSNSSDAAESLSVTNITASGPDPAVYAIVLTDTPVDHTTISITYNSVSMSQIGNTISQGGRLRQSVFRLTGTTGTNATVAASWTTSSDAVVGVMTFQNVNSADPDDAITESAGKTTSPTITITSEVDDMVCAWIGVDSTATTTSTGDERYNNTGGIIIGVGATNAGASPNATIAFSYSGSQHRVYHAFNINVTSVRRVFITTVS